MLRELQEPLDSCTGSDSYVCTDQELAMDSSFTNCERNSLIPDSDDIKRATPVPRRLPYRFSPLESKVVPRPLLVPQVLQASTPPQAIISQGIQLSSASLPPNILQPFSGPILLSNTTRSGDNTTSLFLSGSSVAMDTKLKEGPAHIETSSPSLFLNENMLPENELLYSMPTLEQHSGDKRKRAEADQPQVRLSCSRMWCTSQKTSPCIQKQHSSMVIELHTQLFSN